MSTAVRKETCSISGTWTSVAARVSTLLGVKPDCSRMSCTHHHRLSGSIYQKGLCTRLCGTVRPEILCVLLRHVSFASLRAVH